MTTLPDATGALAWLDDAAAVRRTAGLHRALRPRSALEPVIDLASNDYLGLSRDPRVVAGAVQATRTWGAGSTGSRLVSGSTELHAELEEELAAFCGAAAALVFSSGYTANLGALTALSGPGTLVVSDAAGHASLVDACRLSRARVVVTPRGDVAAVAATLAARSERRALVVTDSVVSVDGGLAPLAQLHAVCRQHEAVLLADEAHGFGVRGPGGRGEVAGLGLAGEPDVVVTMSLSKSLGSQGGAVLGSRVVIDHLVNTARSFIFDTGLAPPAAGAALAALRVLQSDPALPARVRAAAAALAAVAGVAPPAAAVVSVILGEPQRAVDAAAKCLRHGVRVGCLRPPSVPAGTSRLRLTAHAALTDSDLAQVAQVLAGVLGRPGRLVGGAVAAVEIAR
ncbi:MAG TPA: aminotransferase class I/II-fold pyridoxal phosphate-dependent enzyme [Pseudonocardiaceae bacterium]|nr:aminotransferase class I/II-fold pyridoxal phosphate-dependent enzyme [Pseudonocardiaceae bacterium]